MLFFLLLPLITQTDPIPPKTTVFFEIHANGELAQVLCFGKTPNSFDEVLFKGPSGVKIRATRSKDEAAMGNNTEFSQVGTHNSFKIFMNTIFFKQNLPLPMIYTLNGVNVAGIADRGAQEKELMTAVLKEFSNLPIDFQQGLREFYQYCEKSNMGLLTMSAPLNCIFGKQVEPFHVDQIINTNSLDVQNFQTEFNCN